MIHIFGSSGFVGKNLSKFLSKKKMNHLNFTRKNDNKVFCHYNKNSFKLIKKQDSVVFLIAPTSVEKIENKKSFHLKINKKIIKILESINSKAYLIYISSDYVYSGKNKLYQDNFKPNPINLYGKLKLSVEKIVKKRFKKYIILRTPKIFSNNINHNTLYSEIYKNLKRGKKIKVLKDQKIQLLNIEDFSTILIKIIKKRKKIIGNFNIVGKNITRHKFSYQIAKKFNLNKELILPIKLKDITNFKIPKSLVLKTKLYRKINFNINFKI